MKYTELQLLIRLAYSAERAASYAYAGHGLSVRNKPIHAEIKEIEDEEWQHRAYLKEFMGVMDITPSAWLEFKFALIGRIIGLSCFVIGKFMPNYFAGRLESGNVNEYLLMAQLARGSVIENRIGCILEMAVVEKRHELYFLEKVRTDSWLPLFQAIFKWGPACTFNPISDSFTLPENT